MRVLSLFSGIGGFDLACEWAGMEVVGQVEIDEYCRKVLKKHWPNVKRLNDIFEIKGDEFGTVDLIVAGVPCQPASCAGKRRGTEDDRWLWGEALRVVRTAKPMWCVFENPTGILSLQGGIPFEDILVALEAEGYEVQPFIIPASAVGAPHQRERVFIVAHSPGAQCQPGTEREHDNADRPGAAQLGNATEQGLQDRRDPQVGEPGTEQKPERPDRGPAQSRLGGNFARFSAGMDGHWPAGWWPTPTTRDWKDGSAKSCENVPVNALLGRAVHWPSGPGSQQHEWEPPRIAKGVPHRTQRLKALGNAVCPQQIFPILKALYEIERGVLDELQRNNP